MIGAVHVDFHLRKLFEEFAPRDITRSKLQRILDYPGPLSGMCAKADVAYLARLLPRDLCQAIHHLRRVRNEVAHSPDSFRLADHEDRIRKMYHIGPGFPVGINRWACELILHTAVQNILKLKHPLSDEERPAFASPEEVFDYLSKSPEALAVLEEKRPRWELGLGVALICSLIVHKRERTVAVLGDNKLIASLAQEESNC